MTLPYAGTSGWSGSETSRERALAADSTGETQDRQKQTLLALHSAGPKGLTYQELGSTYGWHHGKSSGVLSVLHKEGYIARLAKERRNRCAVYVLPSQTGSRAVAAHGRKDPVGDTLTDWLVRDVTGWSKAGRNPKAFVEAMRAVTGIGT
jgi:hypothetical protein